MQSRKQKNEDGMQESRKRGEGRRRRIESEIEWKETKEIVETYTCMHRTYVKNTKRLNLRMRKRKNEVWTARIFVTPNKEGKEHLFKELCVCFPVGRGHFILLGIPTFRLSLLLFLSCWGFLLVVVV